MTIESVNAMIGELIERYSEMTSEEVSEAVATTHRTFLT